MLGTYKFRARDLNGNLVYGGITADGDFIIVNARKFVTVYKDSIRQLVGYDADGREIYEGDEIVSIHGVTTPATIMSNLIGGDRLKE